MQAYTTIRQSTPPVSARRPTRRANGKRLHEKIDLGMLLREKRPWQGSFGVPDNVPSQEILIPQQVQAVKHLRHREGG